MAKVTLTDLTTLANDTSAVNSLNTNFQTLEDYINNNVLSRDTGAETNTMQNDIDMNSYSLNNVGSGAFTSLTLNGTVLTTVPFEGIGDTEWVWTVSQTANTQTVTTNGATTLDFTTYNNFIITLDGNLTLSNPTTETVGQCGFICFKQDATGSRTLTLGSEFKTVGGGGVTLSTSANAIDLVGYVVISSTEILLGSPQLAYA